MPMTAIEAATVLFEAEWKTLTDASITDDHLIREAHEKIKTAMGGSFVFHAERTSTGEVVFTLQSGDDNAVLSEM